MTCMFETPPPGGNEAFRRELYRGAIFHFARTAGTQRLISDALERVECELGGEGSYREAHAGFSDEEFFQKVGRLRKAIYSERSFQQRVREIMDEHTFDPDACAFDRVRTRAIAHEGYTNPNAAPVYFAHRDTWYANPQAQLTWWIPLHDVTEADTFVFFPECFATPVPNDSAAFDYGAWTRHGQNLRIGWQNPNAGRTEIYPRQVHSSPRGEPLGFSARAGDLILFAGAHLHQTRNNDT